MSKTSSNVLKSFGDNRFLVAVLDHFDIRTE